MRYELLELPLELLVGLLYVTLAMLFIKATPLLEVSDEAHHAGFVFFVKQYGELPNAKTGKIGASQQEATQPPLYYVLAAQLIRNLNTAHMGEYYHRQPDSPIGRADLPGPRNMYRSPGTDNGDTAGALYILRFFSASLLLVNLMLLRLLAKRVFPGVPGASPVAMALVGFNPMVLFICTSVSNDVLLMMLVTASMLVAAGDCQKLSSIVILSVLTGLAILTKISALILLPAYIGYFLFRPSEREKAWKITVVFLTVVFAICAWWFVRNGMLYQELLATQTHMRLAGNARDVQDLLALPKEWDGFVKSFWGVFGAFNIIYSNTIYLLFYGLTALLLFSPAVAFVFYRTRMRAVHYLSLVLCVLNLAAVALWTSRLWGSTGRLLFPTMSCFVVLALSGWAFLPPRMRFVSAAAVIAFLCYTSLYAALFLIPSSYLKP
jgi:hypothetical protein